tara:strand:+ start:1688 stop:2899 length:1212 start_codon:yes stop_codon:yes gene_type:complete
MEPGRSLSKRTGKSFGGKVELAKPHVDAVIRGRAPLEQEVFHKHGIHGATEPDPSGIWKTQKMAESFFGSMPSAGSMTQSRSASALVPPSVKFDEMQNTATTPAGSPFGKTVQTRQRPISAASHAMMTGTQKFQHMVGPESQPAGLAGFLGASGNWSTDRMGATPASNIINHKHATLTHTPYAEVASVGWMPKEPMTKPSWADVGAGSVSKGSIDNSYMPKPLSNRWGKSRELQDNEVRTLPHKQCTDLLHVTLGGKAMPKMTVEQMPSVGEIYAAPFQVAHKVDPIRYEEGWVRVPNIFPGAMGIKDGVKDPTAYRSILEDPGVAYNRTQSVPEMWRSKKHSSEEATEVLKTVPLRPRTAAHKYNGRVAAQRQGIKVERPKFFDYNYLKAGLPGGLSLVEAE